MTAALMALGVLAGVCAGAALVGVCIGAWVGLRRRP